MSWCRKRRKRRMINTLIAASAGREHSLSILDQACTETPNEIADALSALPLGTWRALLQMKGLPNATLNLLLQTATDRGPQEVLGLLVTHEQLSPDLRVRVQDRIRRYEEELASSQEWDRETENDSDEDDYSGYGQYSTGCGGC
jgi:proteasome lid subunit RPN8/RPN11